MLLNAKCLSFYQGQVKEEGLGMQSSYLSLAEQTEGSPGWLSGHAARLIL